MTWGHYMFLRNERSVQSKLFTHRWKVVSLLPVCACISLAPMAVSSASSPAKHLTPLQIGLNYYKGKTVIMICPGPAGSNVDVTERIYAPLMSTYLHANVEVVDYPNGGAATGQDALAGSVPNGLTFGNLNTGTDIGDALTNTPGLTFNAIHLSFIGAYPSSQFVWVSAPSSAYTSFQAVKDSTKPVPMEDVTSGSGNLYEVVVNGVFGIDADVITAYSNPNTMVEGFVRGDAPIAEHTVAVWQPMILAGTARPILLSGPGRYATPINNALKSVPTLEDFAKKNPPKTEAQRKAFAALLDLIAIPQVYAVPAGTPKDDQLALAAAFKAVSINKHVQAVELQEGLPPGYVTPAKAKSLWVSVSKRLNALAPYLNS